MTASRDEEGLPTVRERPPWCNDRGRCERVRTMDHHGCHGHNQRTGEPCRSGWNCPHHDRSPWSALMEPFALVQYQANQAMQAVAEALTDDELFDVIAAADYLNDINCWWAAYDARDETKAVIFRTLRERGYFYTRGLMALFGSTRADLERDQ